MNSPHAPSAARHLPSALPPSPSTAPPRCHWRSVPWLARFFGRSERVIQGWCRDGTLSHLSVYRDKRGRYWIALPDEGEIAIH